MHKKNKSSQRDNDLGVSVQGKVHSLKHEKRRGGKCSGNKVLLEECKTQRVFQE